MKNARTGRAGAVFCSAFMGLLVFALIESAIARRLGWDLFLPAAEGVFLPGRMARLGACVVACLALGLTERGQAFLDRVRALEQKTWSCWLLSALVTAVFFLWALRVIVLSYMISDDVTALQAIARIPAEGLDVATHTFSHILFCAMLGFFYGLAPDLPWYFLYHIAMQLVSLWVVGACVLLKARRRSWPVLAGCTVHLFLCAGLFLYPFAAITFTITAAMVGAAAAALCLCRDEMASPGGRAAADLGGAALLLLCYLQRVDVGKGALCFWGLAAVYQLIRLLRRKPEAWRRRLAALTGAVIVSLGLVLGMAAWKPAEAGEEYWRAEGKRSQVLDSLLGDLQDVDFKNAGVPPELAALLRGWFFMDRRITTERFVAIADAYYTRKALEEAAMEQGEQPAAAVSAAGLGTAMLAVLPVSAPASTLRLPSVGELGSYLQDLEQTVSGDEQMRFSTLIALALLVCCLAGFIAGPRQSWPEMACALCAAGGIGVLSLYLLIHGHFPARAFFVAAFPGAVMLLLLALEMPGGTGKAKFLGGGLLCVGGAAFLALCLMGAWHVPHAADAATRADLFTAQWRIEDYAETHPDLTVINNAYDYVYDPLHSAQYPENLTWWGACGTTTRPEERIYAEVFFDENVRFLGDNFSSLLFLLQYLTVQFGPVQAEMVQQLSPTIFIVDISMVRPSADYTGWYEKNGFTYYYQDGLAASKEQILDGVPYTFAPAGQLCTIAAVDGPNGLIYTTDAYSLVTEEVPQP